jgi:opacity protein-like surface antigen
MSPLMRRLILIVLFPLVASAAPLFIRGSLGFERTEGVHVRDVDCSSTEPPALFGCVAGNDGRALGAYGDFGRGPVFELAVGRSYPRARLELALAHRQLDLDAEANFLGVTGEQPVRGDLRSSAASLNAAIDLAQWRVRPFVVAGAGVARNEIGTVRYEFPGISPDAVTALRGGTRTNFAWSAGAGAAIELSEALALDVVWRWNDLGEVRTEAGRAMIVRPNRELEIDIAGTRADLQSSGVSVSLRWRP